MKIIFTFFLKGLQYIKSFCEIEFSSYNSDSHTNGIVFKRENQERKADILREN